MKKLLLAMLLMALCTSAASATILPATGVDEGYKAWTGIEATPAVVLCESLTVYDRRGDQGGKKVSTIFYTGTDRAVLESWDGWAKIQYSDGADPGWVRNEYLLMDPAWYRCDGTTAVYAYPDAMSPRVALLDAGTELPIITEYDDGKSVNGWVCVSLRGAAGWICKTASDTADETWFRPEMLADLTGALLTFEERSVFANDPEAIAALAELLTSAEDLGGEISGCPFTGTLALYLPDGGCVEVQLATDSCCVYRVDGRDYRYARNLWDPAEGSADNTALLSLFGFDSWAAILASPGNG